jgi:hypothetical protein
MPRRRSVILLVATVALVVVLLVLVRRPWEAGVTEKSLQPQAVMLLPPGNDPRVGEVGVLWTKPGWCVGQFRAEATETATEVWLGTVVSREDPNGACAGVGTGGKMAWAELTLKAPFGARKPIRASDGVALPVRRTNDPP